MSSRESPVRGSASWADVAFKSEEAVQPLKGPALGQHDLALAPQNSNLVPDPPTAGLSAPVTSHTQGSSPQEDVKAETRDLGSQEAEHVAGLVLKPLKGWEHHQDGPNEGEAEESQPDQVIACDEQPPSKAQASEDRRGSALAGIDESTLVETADAALPGKTQDSKTAFGKVKQHLTLVCPTPKSKESHLLLILRNDRHTVHSGYETGSART